MIFFKEKKVQVYRFKEYSKKLMTKFNSAIDSDPLNIKLSIEEINNDVIVLSALTETKDLVNIYAELLACEIVVNFAKRIYFNEPNYSIEKEYHVGKIRYNLEINKQDHHILYDLIDRLEIN